MGIFKTKKPDPNKFNSIVVSLGCDPEFFFSRKGKIIGAEKIIDLEKGMEINTGKIIVDGVQCELNPLPATCRQTLARNIAACFMKLEATLDKNTKSEHYNGWESFATQIVRPARLAEEGEQVYKPFKKTVKEITLEPNVT